MRYRTRHCKKEPGKRPLRRKTGRPSGRTGIQHCRHAEGKDPHGNHFPDHPLLSGPDPETGETAWIALGWKTPRAFFFPIERPPENPAAFWFIVGRSSFRMPDAHASAFEHEKPAAGMGFPSGSPYHVGIKGPTEIHRNEVIEDSVPVTVVSNFRPQRRRGAPQARPSRPAVFIRSQEPAQQVPSCR